MRLTTSTVQPGRKANPRPSISELAAAAQERASSKAKLAATMMQLPLWPDELRRLPDAFRCMPNEIFRSALFNARNRNLARTYFKHSKILVIGEGLITFTGEELRQDDETVWLQLIHLVKKFPPDHAVEFTPYSFCKAIRWSIDGNSYKRLRGCLDRMQATSLAVVSKRLKEGVSLSMIPIFAWKDNETGRALRRYRVQVAPQLAKLFGDVHYTRIEWEQRLALPVGIATWLHGYLASHRNPYAIKIATIKSGAGMTTERASKVRELIEKALEELKNVGFLERGDIVGELVYVKRKR